MKIDTHIYGHLKESAKISNCNTFTKPDFTEQMVQSYMGQFYMGQSYMVQSYMGQSYMVQPYVVQPYMGQSLIYGSVLNLVWFRQILLYHAPTLALVNSKGLTEVTSSQETKEKHTTRYNPTSRLETD